MNWHDLIWLDLLGVNSYTEISVVNQDISQTGMILHELNQTYSLVKLVSDVCHSKFKLNFITLPYENNFPYSLVQYINSLQ